MVEVLQLGLDAFIIFNSAFGVVIGVVGALTLVNIFRSGLARKQLIKELNQKQKLQQSQTETAEEKAIRHNIEAKHRERVQINREKNLRLIQAEHSEQKLDVKALLDHVLNTQEVRIGSAQQLSWSIGYIYCLFYFQKNIKELLETNLNDDAVDWRQNINGSLLEVRFTPQLWVEDASRFIQNNLTLRLESQFIERLIEFAKSDDPTNPFSEGFDQGIIFLIYTSLPRFESGFTTSAESFWEQFELEELDFMKEFKTHQKNGK